MLPVVLILMLLVLTMANPQVATIVVVVLGVGLGQLFPRIGIAYTSWNFAWIHLGIAALLGVITFFLARLLTKEKVILSSKG
jgi:hypothetical protein